MFNRDTVSLDEDYIDEVSIFGGTKKKISAQNFKGGKITTVFGGSEINFLDTQLSNEGVRCSFLQIGRWW